MLKINVGFSRKVGEAEFGSRGASVSLELEAESCLIGESAELKERLRQLFALAKASVDEELNGPTSPVKNGNSHPVNGNGRQRDATRQATASQVRALHAIADRQRLDLTALLQQRYDILEATGLSITEASALIDELKGATNGHGGRR